MEHVTKEHIFTARSTAQALLNGQPQCISANSTIITSKVKEFSSGVTAASMKVTGKATKCMEVEHSHGVMAESTWVNILKTRSKAMESLYGQMEDRTRETGITGNNTEKECMYPLKALKSTENGEKAKDVNGLVVMMQIDVIICFLTIVNIYIN